MLELSTGEKHQELNPVFQSRRKLISMSDRLDPFYEIEWMDAVYTKWTSISGTRLSYGIDTLGTVAQNSEPVFAPINLSASRIYTPIAIKAMACLVQYHQLSSVQMASIIDTRVGDIERNLRDLYSYGIVDNAEPAWLRKGTDRPRGGSGDIWRLGSNQDRLELWMTRLSDLEAKLVSQGRDIGRGTNGSGGNASLRHNLAASELMIRAMEICPSVIGSWGETATQGSLFVSEDTKRRNDLRENIGDGAIVTKDGRIIIIETSGASNLDSKGGEKLEKKAGAWAAIAALSDLDIRVLFVNINPKVRMKHFNECISLGLDSIGKYTTDTKIHRKGRDAVFTANAYDWFPMPSIASIGFANLQSYHTDHKMYFNLAPARLQFDNESLPMVNTIAALHTPEWVLRRISNNLTKVDAVKALSDV